MTLEAYPTEKLSLIFRALLRYASLSNLQKFEHISGPFEATSAMGELYARFNDVFLQSGMA